MHERTTGSVALKPRNFPGWTEVGPQDPPLDSLPTHRAKVMIVTLPDPLAVENGSTPQSTRTIFRPLTYTSSFRRGEPGSYMPIKKEQERITPLEARIRQNFYKSFEFSQQSRDLQTLLLLSINSQYNSEDFRKEFGTLDELQQRMAPRIAKLRMPRNHIEIPNPQNEFERMWAVQLEIFRSHFDEGTQSTPNALAAQF